MRFPRIILYIFLVFFAVISANTAKAENADARMMVHLLDYITVDYSMAVKGQQIINEEEYGEMQEFALAIEKLALKSADEIREKILLLKQSIAQKANKDQVGKLAQQIKKIIIKENNLPTAPKAWPSLEKGAVLYKKVCSSCHGTLGKGDGYLSVTLNPSPTNFHEEEKANNLSPFQAYNTIKLGVANTAMRAFNELKEDEIWDLAFYVISLSHQNKGVRVPEQTQKASDEITLESLASLSNVRLKELLTDSPSSFLSALRLYPSKASSLVNVDFLGKAQSLIKESNSEYANGNFDVARKLALRAYLDGVEPVEMQLSANDASFVSTLESQLSSMRSLIESRETKELVEKEAAASIEILEKAKNIIEDSTFTPGLTFTLSSTIILREGLEAFLVIITMLSLIKSLKLKRAAKWVHGGWIAALVAGVGMWWAADRFFSFSGAQREIMEGAIALFAVIILLYVGFWMHSKSEASKWQAYVKSKIQKLASKESMWGLAILSFLVVFREAFESVLFLSALSSEAGSSSNFALIGGVLTAFVALAIISVLLLKYSKRLPISQLFKYSAIIISVLAVVLVGKGIHAFQESGYVGITNTPFNWRVDLIGLYPTWQSIASQLSVVVLVFILWNLGNSKSAVVKTS